MLMPTVWVQCIAPEGSDQRWRHFHTAADAVRYYEHHEPDIRPKLGHGQLSSLKAKSEGKPIGPLGQLPDVWAVSTEKPDGVADAAPTKFPDGRVEATGGRGGRHASTAQPPAKSKTTRPRGRAPAGKEWCCSKGAYVDEGTALQPDNPNRAAAKPRAKAAGGPQVDAAAKKSGTKKTCPHCERPVQAACKTCTWPDCRKKIPTLGKGKPKRKPAAKKPAEKGAKRRKGTGGEVQRSTAQVSQSLDREEDDAQPTLPEIDLPHVDITPDGVCKLLLEDILFHQHVPNTIHRGNIGEVIFAMIATKTFNCSWGDVEIVGAHATRKMRSGPGDDGRDIIIRGNPPRIVDFKAWSKNGPKIGAKDARSIGGALGAIYEARNGGIGIVATNHDFTENAKQYGKDFNECSKDSYNKEVELWDGKKLRKKIRDAIDAWEGGASGFIKDVLCYLDKKELIKLKYPRGRAQAKESEDSLARKAGDLDRLFEQSLARADRKRTSSQRDD